MVQGAMMGDARLAVRTHRKRMIDVKNVKVRSPNVMWQSAQLGAN